MADAADYAVALGLGGGAAAGGALANSDLANALLVRILTNRRQRAGRPDFRVPVYAGADLNLEHGSGEAMMGSRISRMLNRHGIGSYYANTQYPVSAGEIASGAFQNNTWWGDYVKRNAAFWADNNRIDGKNLDKLRYIVLQVGDKQVNALDILLAQMEAAGVPRAQALRLFESGKFDRFTPGELSDIFKVSGSAGIKDIAAGKAHIMPRVDIMERYNGQKLPYALTGEAGMPYSTITDWKNADRISQNSYPFPESPKTRNLALDTQFSANYYDGSDKLIPGSGVHDPGAFRRGRFARAWRYYAPKMLGGGERSEYRSAIRRLAKLNGIDPRTLGFRTKYMLISTGAAGANAAEKLRLAEEAFKGDKRVRILLQYGKKNPSSSSALDLHTNNGVLEEVARINRERPGFVIPFDRDPAYGVLARNVNLHGAYGGSSSMTEALANTNPTVSMTDTVLNTGNNNYGRARRGFKTVDSGATALGRLVNAGKGFDTVVNTRDGWGRTLGEAVDAMGLRGADYGKIRSEGVQALRDTMYHSPGKFSKQPVDAANRIIAEQRGRNNSFVNTVRHLVTNAIDNHDAETFAKSRGVSKLLRGANRMLFKTPAGRRIGIPLAIASALGLGGAAYKIAK